ncbi:MAG: hypothetical protein FWE88_01440 [Phycisphaerae bacterium]|nr:hypothetical protein [Phycisphaerae bacterium]
MKGLLVFALASVCVLHWAGCGKPVDCTSAVVKVAYWPDRQMNGRQVTVTDKATVDELARFFPKMGQGRTSWFACFCITAATVDFTDADGMVHSVHVGGLGSHDHWSEGRGNWPLSSEFVGYVTTLLEYAPSAP